MKKKAALPPIQESQHRSPLADRMRPRSFSDFLGQEAIFGEGSFLRESLRTGHMPSLILWGPPGSGKTTLALLLAQEIHGDFLKLSAVGSGVKELRSVIERAEQNVRLSVATLLFVDEIHRWNKSQQDSLLPHVERGTIILIGATTENPSFEVNPALLSRTHVIVLKPLRPEVIVELINRAVRDSEQGIGRGKIRIREDAIQFLAGASSGDARTAMNVLEAVSAMQGVITPEVIRRVLMRPKFAYDKGGEEHYNIISALHKSMRGGNADAALYWLARMLEAGEDPLYVARRLIRFASEDVGIANSFALPQAIAAYDACHAIGMPECGVNLAQAVVYLALSQKSNALYIAYESAMRDARDFPAEPVPLYLRNAPTKLMKDLDYGKGYKYTPDFDNKEDANQEYFPEKLQGRKYISVKNGRGINRKREQE